MDLKRFRRVVRSHWWVLILVAFVSIWLATYLTEVRNERMPEREAVASIYFFPALEDVTGQGVDERLTGAATVAIEANAEILESRPDPLVPWTQAEIVVDEAANQLMFVGRGDTDAEAATLAEQMRENLIASGGLERPEDIEQQLNLIANRMIDLNDRIEQLTVAPVLDPEVDTQVTLLRAELSNLQSLYGSLAAMRIAPPPERTVEGIQEDMDLAYQRIIEIQGEIAGLEPPPLPEESLDLQIYRLQYEELQAIYQDLYIRELEIASLNRVDDTRTLESTLTPVPVIANQALGLIAGLLLGIVGLVAADRARNPVWASSELEGLTTLPEIPPRQRRVPADRPWYLATSGGERKAGIQMLRATTDGMWAEGASLGIAGIGTQPEDVAELAADLATSLGVSGRSVLLIDANFEHENRLLEFPEDRLTLSHLLRMPVQDATGARAAMRDLVMDAPQVAPGVRSIPAGSGAADPADIMSGRSLALILDVATEDFDAVIVAGAETDHPITHVLSQRLDAILLLGAAGKTTVDSLETEIRELAARRAKILGLVLLTRSRGRVSRMLDRVLFARPASEDKRKKDQPATDGPADIPDNTKVRELAGRRSSGGSHRAD